MLLAIPDVLSAAQAAEAEKALAAAAWEARADGQHLSADGDAARGVGAAIDAALRRLPLFLSAALPRHILPPTFHRTQGQAVTAAHVSPALAAGGRIRADISAVLFLTDPAAYDGGDLAVEDTYGGKTAKPPAGHLILYPAASLFRFAPVTRGARTAATFQIQSMVRDNEQRALLFNMDTAIQRLAAETPTHPSVIALTGVYHNLLRQWTAL